MSSGLVRSNRQGVANALAWCEEWLVDAAEKAPRFVSAAVFAYLGMGLSLPATPIDLNDFFADPTVTVSADGSSATLAEDQALGFVLLSNDPGLGDPNVIVPGPAITLLFQFDFVEGPGETDEFGAFVIDAATGFSAGPSFEFFAQSSSSGTVAFDLTSLVGKTLGLQFQLSALPGDSGLLSTATVSEVRLQPVPEPSTSLLFASALLLMYLFRKAALGR